jgi:hypothetical protein
MASMDLQNHDINQEQEQEQEQRIIIIDDGGEGIAAPAAPAAGGGTNSLDANDLIQKQLDIMMEIFEENQANMPEGEYLRGVNALCALHRHKQTTLRQRRSGGGILQSWMTLDEILSEEEDLYYEIMDLADDIVIEVCGEDYSIYLHEQDNLAERGEEQEIFQLLMDYKPEEGNAGYESSPMVLHHALQVIMRRLFDDTFRELELVRPVSCQCGWRGTQGNWDRHTTNTRHQRWVNAQRQHRFEKSLEDARKRIVARREEGIVYIDELHETPEVKIARDEAIFAAEADGQRVIFVGASGRLSWFN